MNTQARISSTFLPMALRRQMQSSVYAHSANRYVCLSEANRLAARITNWIETHCGCAFQTPLILYRSRSTSRARANQNYRFSNYCVVCPNWMAAFLQSAIRRASPPCSIPGGHPAECPHVGAMLCQTAYRLEWPPPHIDLQQTH